MTRFEERLKTLVLSLHQINVLKFGDFKMKIGINSPVYMDLRVIISYPQLLSELCDLMCEFARVPLVGCDHVCGVPYAALSIATMVAIKMDRSMLVRRKEAKDYGTKKMVEGVFKSGDSCVIIEDVVTSGLSILETVSDLCREGLRATEAIVVVDREQGGTDQLNAQGIKIRSLLTLTQIMYILRDAGKVDDVTVEKVKTYLEDSRVHIPSDRVPVLGGMKEAEKRLKWCFERRAEEATNRMSAKLLNVMAQKRSTLCVAADVTSTGKVLELAHAVAPYICVFKTHVDALVDFSQEFVQELKQLAKTHNFLIMEDRKFGDIGHTVRLQFREGNFRIADWADLVTVHAIPGPGIIDGLFSSLGINEDGGLKDRACFIVAEMSSKDTLATGSYQAAAVKLAESRTDFVAGVVSQSATGISSVGLVQLTPGVRISLSKNGAEGNGTTSNDGLGQQYNSPQSVVLERGADVAVVGRGITESENPAEAAMLYRDALWRAYEQRLSAD